jgi:hypothetical protein
MLAISVAKLVATTLIVPIIAAPFKLIIATPFKRSAYKAIRGRAIIGTS